MSSTERQLVERHLKLMDRQIEAANQGPPDLIDQFESMMELKRRYEVVFGGGGEDTNARDLFDRLTDFFNTPFGQMVGSQFLKKMGGGSGAGAGRSPRRGLGEAPPRAKGRPKKKRKAKKPKPKRRPPQAQRRRPEERRRAPARARDEESQGADDELDEAEEEGEPESGRWAPSGVPEHFPADELAQAETEEEVLGALMLALMSLNFDPRWHDAVQALLEATVADEPNEALAVATAIAGALVHLGELERDTAELALETMQEHWSRLRAQVLEIAAQDSGPPSGAQLAGEDDG